MRPVYTLINGNKVRLIIRNQWHPYLGCGYQLIAVEYHNMFDRKELSFVLLGIELTLMINKF